MRAKLFKISLFCLVFLFTFVLRAHNYDRTPTPNHLDEMLYAWSGLYLIEEGTPVSWSTLDYPQRAEVFVGERSYGGGLPKASVTLYRPWLDEPPLFSLMVGWFARHFGADRTQFVPSSYIRYPIIFISTAVSLLIFFLTKKISGYWAGLLALLIYGTTPTLVFSARTAMPENVIALFYLVVVVLMLRYHQKPSQKYLYFSAVLAGFAGLCKPTGYFILPLAIFLMVLKDREKKDWLTKSLRRAFVSLLIMLVFVGVYLAYGAHYDWEIFKRIVLIQGFRPAGFGALAWFFTTPSYDTIVLRDSVYVFCLLSAAYFTFGNSLRGPKKIVLYAFVYWVMVVMFSSGENDLLAWYRYPTMPFLAILGAWGIQQLLKKADFFSTFLAGGLLLGNRMLIVTAVRENIQPVMFRNLFITIMTPSLLSEVFPHKFFKWLSKVVIGVVFLVGVYFSSVYVYSAYEIECEGLRCPIVPQTKLGTLRIPYLWRLFVRDEPWNYK